MLGENALVLGDNPEVHAPDIFVMSHICTGGASVNTSVVANDNNIHVYQTTLTMATARSAPYRKSYKKG